MAYCGINRVPKGKKQGTIEECYDNRQIRYYGLHKVDPKLLKKKNKAVNIVEEQLKLRILQERGKRLVRNYKEQSAILEDEESTVKKKNEATKKIEKLLQQRDVLLKKIREQKKYVKSIEKERKKYLKSIKKEKG
jgi:hypothetical protein